MSAWLLAVLAGAVVAALQYGRARTPSPGRRAALATLRVLGVGGAVALLLNAPVGAGRAGAPFVFVDGSLSMMRGDSALWRAAWDSAAAIGSDSVWIFGDTVAPGDRSRRGAPAASGSRVRPAVERAMAGGRPAVIITDGELQDSSALDGLVSGSRIVVLPRRPHRDLALTTLDAPRAAVQGDSVALRVTIAAGSEGAPAGAMTVHLDDALVGRWPIDAMSSWSERQVDVRVQVGGTQGPALLRAAVSSPDDAEPRNDTLSAALEVSRAASAVFTSTSPDQDARFAIAVLRGALALPTRGYLRVAPGRWRQEGSLAATTEAEVRQAMRDAPVAIIHGDTTLFGPPLSATAGPLALLSPPDVEDGEWYASSTPPSPLSGALAAVPLESLPPIAVGAPARGEWTALEARRGREDARRPVVVGRESPRRTVVVSGSGFWRWRFRGGASADAYAALWGGIFDWLAAERADKRGAIPDERVLRAGEPVRWRRGSSTDSVVRVVVRQRRQPRADTLTLRFAHGVSSVESPGLPAGVYDVTVAGGRAALVVNASAEWLPTRARAQSGDVGRASSGSDAGGLRSRGLAYAVVILLLCVEWTLRRRAGLR